jgi:hypothetical protein
MNFSLRTRRKSFTFRAGPRRASAPSTSARASSASRRSKASVRNGPLQERSICSSERGLSLPAISGGGAETAVGRKSSRTSPSARGQDRFDVAVKLGVDLGDPSLNASICGRSFVDLLDQFGPVDGRIAARALARLGVELPHERPRGGGKRPVALRPKSRAEAGRKHGQGQQRCEERSLIGPGRHRSPASRSRSSPLGWSRHRCPKRGRGRARLRRGRARRSRRTSRNEQRTAVRLHGPLAGPGRQSRGISGRRVLTQAHPCFVFSLHRCCSVGAVARGLGEVLPLRRRRLS